MRKTRTVTAVMQNLHTSLDIFTKPCFAVNDDDDYANYVTFGHKKEAISDLIIRIVVINIY